MQLTKTAERLRALALALPEAYEESPWGERVLKVRGKIFLFVGVRDGHLHMSVKLPESGAAVLKAKLGEPTGYGLGKSGWVTLHLPAASSVDAARLFGWVKESYRTIAPKRLAATLSEQTARIAVKTEKTLKIIQLKNRVLLVCHDPLRAERTVAALAARGVTCRTVADASAARAQLARIDALIVDVGRRAGEGLALAAEVEASDHPILLFLVGVRDGATERRARALGEGGCPSADLHRPAGGDPSVADAIVATLTRYAKK